MNDTKPTGQKIKLKTIALATAIVVFGLLLGNFTTSQHVKARGIYYFRSGEQGTQLMRHKAVLEGEAGNPWQYRVLAPYLVRVVFKIFVRLNIEHYKAAAFIFFRTMQDAVILILSFVYYRKLRLSMSHALLGMILLAWGMSYSHYNSDLQFNTFFDVIFYLLAGLCILQGRFVWIIPITILAALNRETSGLIPFLLLATAFFVLPKGSVRKVLPVFISALVSYLAIFIGLRIIYGEQVLLIASGNPPGFDLLWYNISRAITWEQLFATLNIIPIVAMFGYQKWPRQLRVFFWVIVPNWLIIHAFVAVMAEGRLFLVPQAMVFIPGALYLAHQAGTSTSPKLSIDPAGND
jgi:hypothetical protein